MPDADLPAQRKVIDGFRAAAYAGDFDALVAVLDPDVVLRVDSGTAATSGLIRGATAVARQAPLFARGGPGAGLVIVNGAAGVISIVDGRPFAGFSPTVRGGRIVEINILADPERLAGLHLPGFR